jgi:hypothetical protein
MKLMDQVVKVCKLGHGAGCCRYLASDPSGFICAKNDEKLKHTIDKRTDMNAKGDNCNGFREGAANESR